MTNQTSTQSQKDLLWTNISQLPYFRGMLRAVEAKYYQNISLTDPILDLGCGDGHFASTTFNQKFRFGVDPWLQPLKEASRLGYYGICLQACGADLPFPSGYFQTIVSNSVLEHVPDLDPVIHEVSRLLKNNGKFVFCVPNHRFLDTLSISNFFDKIRVKFIARGYRNFFNRISRHYHCDDRAAWEERLQAAGLNIEETWDYFSPKSFHKLEWGHYFGLPSLIWKKLVNRWVLVPTRWNFFLTEAITKSAYTEEERPLDGVYSFYICKKK